MIIPHELVAKRAYDIWEESGHAPGRDRANWEAAEASFRNMDQDVLQRIIEEYEQRDRVVLSHAIRAQIRSLKEEEELLELWDGAAGV